ncbi:MAG: zinc-dependent alcohol dehydrogenase [Planctomycetota bacterium]|jgi:threonine dehydrogenase-like Zn-dependent dehydrogenase
MRTIAVVEPGKVEVVDVGKPEPGPYQAVVKTEIAYLCNATDAKLIDGHFPGVDTYPLVLGHEGAGIVEDVGDKVKNFKAGDRAIGGLVFEFDDPKYASGWGGFCEYVLVNDHDAMVADGVADEEHGWFECYEIQRVVEPDIAVEAAGLLCTWREVYGGFGDFNLQPGDDIVVFGAGPVGLSFVKFGKLLGLGSIVSVDPLANKREKALAMGADAAYAPDSDELAGLVEKRGKPLDAVIDAVGRPAIINQALPMVKLGGSICVYGVVAEDSFTLDKHLGPYNFNLYMHQWPTRRREREAQKPLCDWLREGKLDPNEFMTHEFPMEKINDALDAVKSGEVIKALLRY